MFASSFTKKFFENNENDIKAKGFKLMYNHFRTHRLEYLLEFKDIKFIHLVRKNPLKKYISSQIAQIRRVAHSNKNLPQITINIDTDRAVKSMEQYIMEVDNFRKILANNDVIEISYETFFENPKSEILSILNFLGVPFNKMYCSNQKLTTNDLSLVVENYQELWDKLQGTHLEKFLNM